MLLPETNAHIRFLFPSYYFERRAADPVFVEQVNCLRSLGFKTLVISLESLGSRSPSIYPIPDPGTKLVYRGWMLTPDNYSVLEGAIKKLGAELLVSREEYESTHYLPNWYPLLSDLTPLTHFFSIDDDLESELSNLGWNKFLIKDYVKSLKTSAGSIISSPSEIRPVIAEIQKFRGGIEGGICVRQVEDFILETEKRYFIINGKSFAASPDEDIPNIVKECIKRIDSKFFSVDVIDCLDGYKRIVEIGDGQVSDLVGWTAERFAFIWVE